MTKKGVDEHAHKMAVERAKIKAERATMRLIVIHRRLAMERCQFWNVDDGTLSGKIEKDVFRVISLLAKLPNAPECPASSPVADLRGDRANMAREANLLYGLLEMALERQPEWIRVKEEVWGWLCLERDEEETRSDISLLDKLLAALGGYTRDTEEKKCIQVRHSQNQS